MTVGLSDLTFQPTGRHMLWVHTVWPWASCRGRDRNRDMMALAGQVLGDTEGLQHTTGWAWRWVVLGWSSLLTLVSLAMWSASRASGRPSQRLDAGVILVDRFARGELTVEENEERGSAPGR